MTRGGVSSREKVLRRCAFLAPKFVAGLEKNQACLLRGTRELVLTAPSFEELEKWHKALCDAISMSQLPQQIQSLKIQNEDLQSKLSVALLDADMSKMQVLLPFDLPLSPHCYQGIMIVERGERATGKCKFGGGIGCA